MADHAVVIGVQAYPDIGDLAGPCNDVDDVIDWLVAPDGGNLSCANINIIKSTDYSPPTSIHDAHPTESELRLAFNDLIQRAILGQREEGRLFIYVAGHGFADSNQSDSAALIAAEASTASYAHLAVPHYFDFFIRCCMFDEVILIMDTCRVTSLVHSIIPPPLPNVPSLGDANKVKRFRAFGTGFNQLARERPVDGNGVRGIFTMALLDALRNATPNERGRLTGSVIKNYVHNVIDRHASGTHVEPPVIDVDSHKEVVFAERDASGCAARFIFQPTHIGRQLLLHDGYGNHVCTSEIVANSLTIRLTPGRIYKAQIPGVIESRLFELTNDATIKF